MAQLRISRKFFQMETREDFPVGELMKRNWAAQLQVLEDVRELCERHGIRYFAYAGTMLGAVRHKGFIPWDDDVDLMFIGEDFIDFLYYAKDELDDRYDLLSPYASGDWDMRSIARLVNANTIDFGGDRLDAWHDCPFAIGTDVFPFYYVPRDSEKDAFICELLERIEALLDVNTYSLELIREGKEEAAEEVQPVIAESILRLQEETGFSFTAERTLENQLAMLYDQVCRFTTEEEADYVTRYNVYLQDRGWKFRKELFEETVQLPFEMIHVPAPKAYDEFLRIKYGEYWEPVKFAAAHDYPYFGAQIRTIKNTVELLDWTKRKGDAKRLSYPVPKRQKLADSRNPKCMVLYYTGVREMMIYGEYAIGKIKDLLSYFEEHRSTMSLWWCPGAFLEPWEGVLDFQRLVPELMERYDRLVEEYRESGLGICDESGDLNRAIDACDLYYGDEGFLSERFGQSGKPVYIQDYHTRWMEEEAAG